MAYTSAQGRRELLDALATAIDDAGRALAALGAAYEQLDERTADELEEGLFGPVQRAYGRARRAHAAFAARHGMASTAFEQPPAVGGSTGVRARVEQAVAAVEHADATIAELQDSLLPVEVGDPEVRAALSDVRETLSAVPAHARALLRHLGR